MIYHVVANDDWQDALTKGFYSCPSLTTEGFIHCSFTNQVADVLKRYYAGQKNLLLLHIDENKLTAELKYEIAPSVNELFPHIFGKLNIDAIVKIGNI